MKPAFIALWGLVSWLAVELLVFTPLFLAGGLLLPVILRVCPIVQVPSTVNAGQMVEALGWRWANILWGNLEDGLSPVRWTTQCGTSAPTWRTRLTWYFRNPVSNMRFWPWISTFPKASVMWIGTLDHIPDDGIPGWFLAWQGPYTGFRWQCCTWGLWIGWKLNPADRNGCTDYRRFGLGTAAQLMRFRL